MDFLRRLVRPPVLIGVGVGLFSATALVVFNLLKLSLLLALLIILTVVLAVVIVVLLRQLKAARAAEEIERSISRQADRDIERSVPGKVAEMQDMKADLLAAIQALKSSKMGRRGQSALSILPWYMVIGPAGAGKSAMIARSGLHFPLLDEARNPRSVKGVGGTRSFEWWLSQEAVLLDMGGRTLGAAAQFEDTEDWVAFLDTLKQQRKEKPLNGVIVAVALDQLADREEPQVDGLARSVRERVQELVHHLGVVFPVYVTFTKCDLLAGFAEFFAELTPQERRQPWGATLSAERAEGESAEALFDAEFPHLTAALSQRRMGRMATVPDALQRARTFAFPLQLERVRPRMRRFLKVLFEPDPLEESPLFRGFYLASAQQEGTPVDRVLRPAAQALGLPAPAGTAPALAGNEAFFVSDLLTRVVFPDADLATRSRGAEAAARRARVLMFAGLGVAFLTVAVLLSVLAMLNGRLVGSTRRAAVEVAERVRPDAQLMENLQTLEDLRARVAIVDSLKHRKPFWRTMGGYSGDALLEPALQLYEEKAIEDLVAPAVTEMEQRLMRMTDSGEGDFLHYYSLFRAWRLLTEPKQLTPDDAPVVGREMAAALGSRLAFASPTDRERFPRLIARQAAFLAAHKDGLVQLAPGYYRMGNPDLVGRGAARVRNTWDSSQFYRQLIAEAAPQAKPATFAGLVGTSGLLSGSYAVPGPYTRAGWEQQVQPRVEWYREQIRRDWVVADAFQGRAPDLAHDLLAAYARDYSAQWAQFLNSMNVPAPRDLEGAAVMLSDAAQNDSPILKALRAVSEQTTLGVDERHELAQVQHDFQILHEFFEAPSGGGGARKAASFLARFFQRPKPGQGPDLLDRNQAPNVVYLAQLKAAYEKVKAAAQPGAPASQLKQLMAEGDETTNPLKQLSAWVRGLAGEYAGTAGAEPTARLLQLPIASAGAAVGGGMRAEVNTRWGLLVGSPFQKTLAGKYPLVPGGPDATLFDFAEFFRPGGTFWSFYDHELKDFVLEDGTPKSAEGSVVSPALQECLHHAYEIREAFFGINPASPTLRFSVQTKQPAIEGPHVNVRWVALDLGGLTATYSMGAPQWQPFEWPGTDPGAGAALRVQTAGGPQAESRSAPGPWGLFHLIDQGSLGQGASGYPSVTWRLAAGSSRLAVVYEIQPGSARHPFRPGFLRFTLPSSL